jgi:hypothetical protein
MLPFGLLLRDTTPNWLALPMPDDEPPVIPPELATDKLQADDDGPGCGCAQFNSCCFTDVVESLLFGGDMPSGISGSANFLIWCITPKGAKNCLFFPLSYIIKLYSQRA